MPQNHRASKGRRHLDAELAGRYPDAEQSLAAYPLPITYRNLEARDDYMFASLHQDPELIELTRMADGHSM